MKKAILTSLILTGIYIWAGISGTAISQSPSRQAYVTASTDTLQDLQQLYNGLLWTNKYRRYEGDQFFLTSMFIKGSVTINCWRFDNVKLKYDIYSDEIIAPLNAEDIIQLNREMIDSFSLNYQNKTYRFINFRNDSLTGFNGYYNVLYSGKSLLYARYQKTLSVEITSKSDGEFIQLLKLYVKSGNNIYQVKSKKDFFRITGPYKQEVKKFLSTNRMRISKNEPDSFIAALQYFDMVRNHY